MTKINKIKNSNFSVSVSSYHDMMNKHLKIDNILFYCKRLNEFGESVLQKINEDGSYETIANVSPAGKKIILRFVYNGLHCRQDIFLKSIKISENQE